MWLKLRSLGQRRAVKREIDEELRFHLEQRTAENIAAGMAPEAAAREARKRFGNMQSVREECRDARGASFGETVLQDFRFGARILRKHPLGNAVIVLTIAVLIGAVSVIYATLRENEARLEPFPESNRLVKLWGVGLKGADELFPATVYNGLRANLRSFEALGAIEFKAPMTFTGTGEPVTCSAVGVTASLLHLAGIAPIRGRLFDEVDAVGDGLVVISEQMWRDKLGADDRIIGRSMRLDGRLHTVVGVLPESMRTTHLAYTTDIWILIQPDRNDRLANLKLVGRLNPGVTLRQAQAEFEALAPRLEEESEAGGRKEGVNPDGFTTHRVVALGKQVQNSRAGVPVQLILVWVWCVAILGSVVGIACFNITNLLLARQSARSREIAIRFSLGATRVRVVRQLLAETMLLSLMGGVFGLAVSSWLFRILKFQHVDPRFDWRLYLLAFCGTLVLGILVGLAPAIRSSRKDLAESLKDGGLAVGGSRRHRLRTFLVSSEVAMALVLCVVAGLLARTWFAVYSADPGFDPKRLISIRVQLRPDVYQQEASQAAYIDSGLRSLRETPGVEAASVCMGMELIGFSDSPYYTIPGRTETEQQQIPLVTSSVGPGFPEMLGMRVLRGHGISGAGSRAAAEVWVNETFAAKYFPGINPIGREIRAVNWNRPLTIAGVLRDRHPLTEFGAIQPEVFRDFREVGADLCAVFVVRTRGNAKAMAAPLRELIMRLDPSQPVNQPEVVSDLFARRAARARPGTILFGVLALAGLLLALTGVYGVVSHSVVERTREVGIRVALGASGASILRLMFWQGARLMFFGAPIGFLIGASVVSALPTGEAFHGISPLDPPTYLAVTLMVGIIGFCASYFPARRASRINPMEALRHE
jgi:putative ABC transport system permease protein